MLPSPYQIRRFRDICYLLKSISSFEEAVSQKILTMDQIEQRD